jgi:hypothetical protein
MIPARLLLASAVLLCTSALATTASAADEPKKDGDAAEKKKDDKADDKDKKAPEESAAAGDMSDVTELAHKTYYYVGLRYRGTVIPKFMVNLFVDEGATFYSNGIGLELDMRKDGESKVFGLSYIEYGTGDTIFLQKGHKPGEVGWMSYVNSGLKGIYATADFLYSVDLNDKKNLQFEYGFGAGLGVLFGDLVNNWIYADNNGPLVDSAGNHYSKCAAGATQPGCNKADHQNASTAKVGGYVEPTWFGGGSVPNIFPYLALQFAGLRYKPIRDLETRAGVGFSLTGFYFTLSADWGLPKNHEANAGSTKRPTVGNRAFAY